MARVYKKRSKVISDIKSDKNSLWNVAEHYKIPVPTLSNKINNLRWRVHYNL